MPSASTHSNAHVRKHSSTMSAVKAAAAVGNLRGSRNLRLLRIAYYVFHVTTLVAGFGLIASGALAQWTEADTIETLKLHVTRGISAIAYVTGVGSIVAGSIGLAALFLDKKPYLWIIYCILMAVITLTAFAGSVSSANQGSASVRKEMKKLLMHYTETPPPTAINRTIEEKVDEFQIRYKCCGLDGYQDWQTVEYGRTTLKVPMSCCKRYPDNPNYLENGEKELALDCGDLCMPDHPNATKWLYAEGCFYKMTVQLDERIRWLTGMGALCCGLAGSLFVLSCYLVISKQA